MDRSLGGPSVWGGRGEERGGGEGGGGGRGKRGGGKGGGRGEGGGGREGGGEGRKGKGEGGGGGGGGGRGLFHVDRVRWRAKGSGLQLAGIAWTDEMWRTRQLLDAEHQWTRR